jgi:iron(III) transport system permease protein
MRGGAQMSNPPGLRLAAIGIAGVAVLPLLVVLSSFAHPEPEIWQHLASYVLPRVLLNTLWLSLGVLIGVLMLGVPLAWLVTQYRFPGVHIFSWALMLPLAIPAYVMAFVQVGLLDFTGPLQTFLREIFGQQLRLPPIRGLAGGVLVLSLAFYPYVYLLARNAFLSQGVRLQEVGQSLGLSPGQVLWRLALPMARPWIAAGCLLVLMETLADFGAVYVLGIDTFTTAIYKAWFALFSLPAATQLASLLIVVALLLIALEQWQRGRRRFASADIRRSESVLTGAKAWAATAVCAAVLAMAFVLPCLQLLLWIWQEGIRDLDSRYIGFIQHSVQLAAMAAGLVVALSVVLAYAHERVQDRLTAVASAVARLGYAIPGSVLAVGVFIPVAWLDNQIIAWWGDVPPVLFKGSVLALLIALVSRFLSVGYSPVSSGFQRVKPALVLVARSLGERGWGLFRRIYLPLLRSSLAASALLVLIDVLKEMPITLMMRPFGWDTLAIRIFEMTSEGEWGRAALPSFLLVLAGLLPVVLLVRTGGSVHDP